MASAKRRTRPCPAPPEAYLAASSSFFHLFSPSDPCIFSNHATSTAPSRSSGPVRGVCSLTSASQASSTGFSTFHPRSFVCAWIHQTAEARCSHCRVCSTCRAQWGTKRARSTRRCSRIFSFHARSRNFSTESPSPGKVARMIWLKTAALPVPSHDHPLVNGSFPRAVRKRKSTSISPVKRRSRAGCVAAVGREPRASSTSRMRARQRSMIPVSHG